MILILFCDNTNCCHGQGNINQMNLQCLIVLRSRSVYLKESVSDLLYGEWYTEYLHFVTRMHSRRMRTGRSLTVFRRLLLGGGVPGPGGGYLFLGGCTWSGGVPGLGGCAWSRGGVPGPGGSVCLVPGCVCTWSGGDAWSGTPPPPL